MAREARHAPPSNINQDELVIPNEVRDLPIFSSAFILAEYPVCLLQQ